MNKRIFVLAAALALAAGSAQAAGKMGGAGGMDRSPDRTCVQVDGIPCDRIPGYSVDAETARLPDSIVLAGAKPGIGSGSN